MHRRDFLLKSAAATAATAALVGQGFSPADAAFAQTPAPATKPKKNTFKLKYGPHFGMFKAHAGEDLLDQLRFMADVGFTAFEDNGLMKRPVGRAGSHRQDAGAVEHDDGRVRDRRRRQLEGLVRDGQARVQGAVPEGVPRCAGHGQAREREVGHVRPWLLRAEPAHRHPDRARDRHPEAGRRHPGAEQPDDGARAAQRQPGSVPALRRIRPT